MRHTTIGYLGILADTEKACGVLPRLNWLVDDMQLIGNLLHKPTTLPAASKYTVLNGLIYVAGGMLLTVWPKSTQILFMERAFVETSRVSSASSD